MPQIRPITDLLSPEEALETAAIDAAIAEAEAEFAQSNELHDAREAFSFLRRKYFGDAYTVRRSE